MMPAPLAPPPRDARLDLLRGWMQLSIFASHAYGSFAGAWLIHAAWGLSDSSEQFVLLSGFGLGSVFALKSSRGPAAGGGFRAATTDLLRRALRLWRRHLLVFLGFAALVLAVEMAVPLPGETAAMGWGWLLREPWLALPGAASLLYQPEFMGILPLFVWCMLLLPAFLWGVDRVGAWALLPPALLYGAVQAWAFAPPTLGGTEVAFNPFAWQILFVLGAWFGRRALHRGRAVRGHPALLAAALAVAGFGLWVRLIGHGWLPDPGLRQWFLAGKEALAPPRLLHALSLAYLFAALVPPWAATLRALPLRALAAAGRRSLDVFCAGLFLSYVAAVAFRTHPADAPLLDLLLVPGGAVLLLAFALVLERRRPRAASPPPARPRAVESLP
jgi:hypothetical protein